jgi:hypothetical protein
MKRLFYTFILSFALMARPVNAEVLGKPEKIAFTINAENPSVDKEPEALEAKEIATLNVTAANLYQTLQLKKQGLSLNVFSIAYKGYNSLKNEGLVDNNKLTICDFSKSSGEKRMFIIDMLNQKFLFKTLVAHGKNSGSAYANQFSNVAESNKSSLGFYITEDTYQGSNGYSLHLQGKDKGFNDNAYDRSVVIHGADYVNEGMANSQGFVGRSFGCPSVAKDVNEKVINYIKNGSCLFIYHPSKDYLKKSTWLK